MSDLTHIDLFAGIGGCSQGLQPWGVKTVAYVEVDRNCQTVLRRHNPDRLILGDIRECGAHNLPHANIITFGSPCQDLSVAGTRLGLEGSKSGLFFEGIRVIKELQPDIAIWENVPGAFSSNKGNDFGIVLDALAESGAVDIGWRVLDSQWFRVAQRRRRVFVVADFRERRVGQILSIPSRHQAVDQTRLPRHGCLGTGTGSKLCFDGSFTLIVDSRGCRITTPLERERLQGFTDGWTEWGVDRMGRRVEMSDTTRYKMLGNAITVKVFRWLGYNVSRVLDLE